MDNCNFTILVTVSEKRNDLDSLLSSLVFNSRFINKVIFISEERAFFNLTTFITKYNLGNLFEKYTIIDHDSTSKIEKLRLSSKLVSDNSYVVILDEDDILNSLFELTFEEIEYNELLLTPLMWTKNNEKKVFKFNPDIDHWYSDSFFPYYNNHNSIPRGSLFKKVMKNISNYSFQKHEDVLRSILYISEAKNIKVYDEEEFCTINYIINNDSITNESMLLDKNKDSNSISLILELLNEGFNYSQNEILKMSQINSLKRIARTAYFLFDEGWIKKETFSIIKKVLEKENISTNYESLFHSDELKSFYETLKKEGRAKWFG